ncbi:hypothetical protein SCHPADRAFT_898570 [Schizopora paradoxa]|uniref:DUF6533 domain-containing protein n=1 Tax=Schizopora paradoxa TaxID=27342 RepID=A0A0H2SRC3_9AGAM|nr:hypothetical protein SCHPADRAFT_898570 [Schizopora paradoxa]
MLYDVLITFGDEVEYVWSAPWSFPKVCFLFSRYYGAIAVQILTFQSLSMWTTASEESTFDGSSCTPLACFKAITAVLLGLSVEVVMLLRVLALYGNTRRILIFLVATYIIEFTATCTLMGVTVHNILVQTIPFAPGEFLSASPLTGCNPLTVPFYFSSYWIAMILFQSILFGMMVLNMIRGFLSRCGLEGAVRTPLLSVFFRDGTVFYAMILAALLANLILFKVSDSPVSQFAICLHLTGLSLAVSVFATSPKTQSVTNSSALDSY